MTRHSDYVAIFARWIFGCVLCPTKMPLSPLTNGEASKRYLLYLWISSGKRHISDVIESFVSEKHGNRHCFRRFFTITTTTN